MVDVHDLVPMPRNFSGGGLGGRGRALALCRMNEFRLLARECFTKSERNNAMCAVVTLARILGQPSSYCIDDLALSDAIWNTSFESSNTRLPICHNICQANGVSHTQSLAEKGFFVCAVLIKSVAVFKVGPNRSGRQKQNKKGAEHLRSFVGRFSNSRRARFQAPLEIA